MCESLKNIVHIVEEQYMKNVNTYLSIGWILLRVPNEDSNYYILGWNKNIGEVKHPEKDSLYDPIKDWSSHIESNQILKDFFNDDESDE